MKKSASLVLTFLLLAQSYVLAFHPQEVMPRLTNKQIVEMVRASLSSEVIISKIKTSRCNFDTDPALLAEMKHNGVPNEVLQAMVEAPYGAPKQSPARSSDAPSGVTEPTELKKDPQLKGDTSSPEGPAGAFSLAQDTPIRLKLARTMSSQDAKVDEKVDFEVLEDVKVGEVVVIQHGAMAIATVTEAQPKRTMGRAGKLVINIDYVKLVDGEKVQLRSVKGGSGGTHTAAMTGAIVATAIVFFPAAPFFLFMHGKDITIPKGTEITAYVAANTPFDPAKFKQSPR